MKGKIHEHPNANTSGFKENPQNINKSGRPVSILNAIKKKLLDYDHLDISGMLLNDEDEPTGTKVKVRVQLDTIEGLALHYLKRSKASDRVLLDLIDRIDGKPNQKVEASFGIDNCSDEQIDRLYDKLVNAVVPDSTISTMADLAKALGLDKTPKSEQ